MAIYKEDIVDIELESGTIHRSWLNRSIGLGDVKANRFGIRAFRNGEAENIEGSTCIGFFMRPDGTNLQIQGSTYTGISGNKAWVALPQDCYAYEGQFTLAVKVISSGADITGTMRIVDGMVDNTGTSGAVSPTSTVPSSAEIIAAYEDAVAVIDGSVRHDITQSLTDAQKGQARGNIGAASNEDVAVLFERESYAPLYVYRSGTNGGKQDESATLSISVENNRDYLMTFSKPSGYVYMSPFLGMYSDISGDSFVASIENIGSTDIDGLELMLSSGETWPDNPPIVTPYRYNAIPAGKTFVTQPIRPSDYAGSYTYSAGVFLIVRFQATDNNKSVSIKVNITQRAQNAKTAYISEFANRAGGDYLDNVIEPYLYNNNSGQYTSWSLSGRNHVLFCDDVTATGQVYGSISWDIKALFGKGIRLIFDITNANGNANGWYFSDWYLSRYNYSWASKILTINPALYSGDAAAKKSKFIIDIDRDFAGVDYASEDHVYLIAAAFKNNPSVSAENTLGIMASCYKDNSLVIADSLKGFTKDAYYTKEQISDLLDQSAPNVDIIFWGDSLTAGAGGGGTTYPAVCANMLGLNHKNCGVGGETEQTIAARQGGNSLMIQPGSVNGNYSFSQMLDYCGKQILPLRQGTGGNTVNPVIINGQSCQLSLTDETYTISGYTGTLLNAVPALFNGAKDYGDITVIFVGANGLGSNTVEERISYIRSMVTRIRKKYVIMGISYGTESDRAADDAAMRKEFGNHFFPTRKMLVNYGLAVAGITPTAQDNTDIAAGTVPTSLRSDHIHLNANGYTALGKMLASFIVGLGYAEYASN